QTKCGDSLDTYRPRRIEFSVATSARHRDLRCGYGPHSVIRASSSLVPTRRRSRCDVEDRARGTRISDRVSSLQGTSEATAHGHALIVWTLLGAVPPSVPSHA